MTKKSGLLTIGLVLFLSILSPRQALADLSAPLSMATIPLLPIIIIIEVFVFLLIANKIYKAKIGLWKIAIIIVISNVITSLLGTVIHLYKDTLENLQLFVLAFVCTVLIEWGIYIPFFWKNHINYIQLLIISFYANIITYACLFVLIRTTHFGF